MKALAHALAAATAMLTIASFWIATAVVESFADHTAVQAVKHFVVQGLFLLVPAMAATAGTGFALARGRVGRLLERKKRRMPFIAINGIAIMIPAALFLDAKAAGGEFDAAFYAVQGLELAVGAIQLRLMGLNFRAGLSLAGRRGSTPASP